MARNVIVEWFTERDLLSILAAVYWLMARGLKGRSFGIGMLT
jgi:hypothetical protein